MNTPSASPAKSITDSPWYWVYLFCTAGAIALLLAGPKFVARQAQIERNSEDRIDVARQLTTPRLDGTEQQISRQITTRVTLWPLYIVLGIVLSVAWFNLWRWHRRIKMSRELASRESAPPRNEATA